MDKWDWQTSALILVVMTCMLAVVGRFVITGADVPTGVITLLSFFGGAVLGVGEVRRARKGSGDDK